MPFRFTEKTTESGARYLRVDAEGRVSLDDAKEFQSWVMRPEWHLGLIMSVVGKGTAYDRDARKVFQTLNEHITALATVVTSPIVRAAINMMLRLARSRGTTPLRMFTSEEEALRWLESRRGDVPPRP
ncbi:MAG: hypothetical protein H6713_35780 [Myxococcales bacterium]|nr:hypothetical protein [Myxococcales bacterium]MCB9755332.1 hypothetical protein [Myxococcales bacterium]